MKRKGARSKQDISDEILQQLNLGLIETANLVEWLAVDQRLLLKNLLKQNNRIEYLEYILLKINALKKQTVTTINEAIGLGLYEQIMLNKDVDFLVIMSKHQADLVRCWTTYSIGSNESLSIENTLEQIQPFAADDHFGVREISWMVVRTKIIQNLRKSIDILSDWTTNPNENIRRFTTESTRPRGVWCEHIEELKKDPELALPILETLKSDNAKYVQDSVGNWLNDAGKTQPEFVKTLCHRWQIESTSKSTQYITKKALRNLVTL